MARPQDNPAPFTTPYSRDDDASPRGGGGGCGCFRRFCFGRDDGGSRSYLLLGVHEETWLVGRLKKVKQLSELVAGPKWKNLIRKIGKLCHHKKQAAPPFQYSPESYALNFAADQDQEQDGNLLRSFSTRFAPRVDAAL